MSDIVFLDRIKDGEEVGRFLQHCPSALLYATPHYVNHVGNHLNAQGGWLAVRDQGSLCAILPFLVKSGPLGSVYNSMAYYGSNGGVVQVGADLDTKRALVQHFYALAEENKAASATLITNPLEKDTDFYMQYTPHDLRDERLGQITHFPVNGDPEKLIDLFDDPRPRNIRRSIKGGVRIVRAQDEQAMDFLYKTHEENMRAIGGLAKRRDFFDILSASFAAQEWEIYMAYLEDHPVAALLVLYAGKTVEYFTPVVVEQYRSTQALTLCIYTAMQDAMRAGYAHWNWGGTWLTQDGVYDFKKRWGTAEYTYYYYTKIYNSALYTQSRAQLLGDYEGFYVLPFSALKPQNQAMQGVGV